MFDVFGYSFNDLMTRGGIVMWPLLALSVLATMLSFERLWFWLRQHRPANVRRMQEMAHRLRQGERAAAGQLAAEDRSIYGQLVRRLVSEDTTEALAVAAVENQRPRLERFMATLSTIITAAPMLGILGTVLGIISSFQVLSDKSMGADPRLVSQGIAEALLTTAAGLILSLAVLLPYNLFRSQMDRALSRLETLIAAALASQKASAEKH